MVKSSGFGVRWEESNGLRKKWGQNAVSWCLDHIVVLHPEQGEEHPQNLCSDAGYTGSGEAVEQRNYIPHIRPRGEEKKALERNPDFRARRWVVEVTHSFFNRFRKLLVRYEKKAVNYMALLQFACAVIVWRKLIRVHR